MPYVAAELSGRRTHNFGFHGYGPHQMLSAIEHGVVERIVDCDPEAAIYQTFPFHVARSAGYASWDEHGPKYLMRAGHVEYVGHFDDRQHRFAAIFNAITEQFNKSSFYRNFVSPDRYSFTEDDIELFLSIVAESRRKLIARYPTAQSHVVLWNIGEDKATLQKIWKGLKERGVQIHLISDILPNFRESRSKYEISTHDRHPSPLAHRLIAEYLVTNVIDDKE
jgi:hypothetical protein